MDNSTNMSICRTCLLQATQLNSLFDSIEFENETLQKCDMISICMGLEIKADDTLTKYICHKCDQEITRYYMFRKKCYESEILLKMKQESEASSEFGNIFEAAFVEEVYKSSDENTSVIYLENPLKTESDEDECDIKVLIERTSSPESEQYPKQGKLKLIPDYASADDTEIKKKGKSKQNKFPTLQKCDFCRRTFLSIEAYTSHIESHKKLTQFLCNICGQVFKTKSKHWEHMYRHENRSQCSICEKSFLSPSQLRLHMVKHTGEKPHKCEICGAAYTQQSYFKIHMRTHTGERPYKCQLCDKSFVSCSARKRHQVDHQDPALRPFQCHICPKNFRRKVHHHKHLLTHTGEKSQICPYCDKAFLFRKGLVRHMRSHAGKKQHDCQYCDKQFLQKHFLMSHVASHHKCDS